MTTGIAELFTTAEIDALPGDIEERLKRIQERVNNHLNALFERARAFCARVNADPKFIPLFFLATAGMRIFKTTQPVFYGQLLKCIEKSAKGSDFHFDPKDPSGPSECGSITGETEALYGWIAANYFLGFFSGYGMRASQTVGYVEMGGASAQIAYKLIPNSATDAALALADANIEVANATLAHTAAETTRAADAGNQAWIAAATALTRATEARNALQTLDTHATSSGGLDNYEGRLAKVNIGALEFDLFLASYNLGTVVARREYNAHLAGGADPSKNNGRGTGNSNDVDPNTLKGIIAALGGTIQNPETIAPAPERPNPDIVGSSNRSFVGGSNFWYSTRQIFGLDKNGRPKMTHFSFKEYNDEIRLHLSLNWESAKNRRPKVSEKFLEQVGFTAAWVQRALFAYFRFREDGPTVSREDKLTFRPYNGSNGVELSWTLGRVVLYAMGDPKPQQMTGPQARELDYLCHQVKNDDIRWAKLEDDVHDAEIVVGNENNLVNRNKLKKVVRERNSLKAGRVARRRVMEAKEESIRITTNALAPNQKFFVLL